jgi:hypothetical protein
MRSGAISLTFVEAERVHEAGRDHRLESFVRMSARRLNRHSFSSIERLLMAGSVASERQLPASGGIAPDLEFET